MKVPRIVVFLLACVSATFSQAAPPTTRLTGHDLLERAYAIAPELRERERMNLMLTLCRVAGRHDSALAVKYGSELWRRGSQMNSPGSRAFSEAEATEALSASSPDVALD